jgi:tRNA (mo5U34)-methyltransferase
LKPWHHLIDVHGVPTKTEPAWGEYLEHPRRLWAEVSELLPDLRGKRVLDVGCNDGFFLFACRQLGAEHVVGIEPHEHFFNHAVLVNQLLDLGRITIRQMTAYDVGDELGRFDVTLALGLIYHLKSPLLFLERVAPITTSMIVVETAIRNSEEDRKNRERGAAGAPAMEFVENSPAELHPEGGPNWWTPNVECVEAMLRVCGFPHTSVASEFILTPGPDRGPAEFGRAIVVGTKADPGHREHPVPQGSLVRGRLARWQRRR